MQKKEPTFEKSSFTNSTAHSRGDLGGTVFLSSDTNLTEHSSSASVCSPSSPADFFGLFTGKVCYTLDNKPSFLGTSCRIWSCNMASVSGSRLFARFTRNYQSLNEKCGDISAKLSDSLVSLLLGNCIYIAINSYKTQDGLPETASPSYSSGYFIFCWL